MSTSPQIRAHFINQWKPLLDQFEIGDLDNTGAGADIEHMAAYCPLLAELHTDSQRYFDFHHTGIRCRSWIGI
jgi:hypothetical protein